MQIIKSGFTVAFFTLISRIFGYIRDILMASYLGLHADSFAVAFRLPNTFRSLFAEGAFSAAFVPMFSAKLAEGDKERAFEFASRVFSLLSLIVAIFVGIMMLFMPSLVKCLAPGFVDDFSKFTLTVTLSYFTIPYLFFIALASLFVGVLNSCGKFAITAALPIILNLVMIIAIYFLTPLMPSPSHALAIGVFAAGICQLAAIIYAAKLASVKIVYTKIFIDEDMKKMFSNMLPAIIGSGVVQINLAIDTIIASFIDGAASILYFADRLNQFPLAIIGTALGTVLLPTLSKQIKTNQHEQANITQNKAIEIAMFLTLPCSVAFAVMGDNIIALLFERGHFMHEDTFKVYTALSALAVGLPAFVLVKILTPRYFAHYDTKTPVKISAFCIITNVVFSLTLINFISYAGIALATSLSAWINVSLLSYFLVKKDMFTIDRKIISTIAKIVFTCTLMALVLILIEKNLVGKLMSGLTSVLIEICCAMAVYFITSYYLKIIDFSIILKGLKKNG
jgi:putative peptidoglycan lipid II flippase